jgi:hypothetical protein
LPSVSQDVFLGSSLSGLKGSSDLNRIDAMAEDVKNAMGKMSRVLRQSDMLTRVET